MLYYGYYIIISCMVLSNWRSKLKVPRETLMEKRLRKRRLRKNGRWKNRIYFYLWEMWKGR